MPSVLKGMVAGLIATAVLSLMMVAKTMMGIMPELNVIKMLSGMMSAPPVVGWVMHFVVGAMWGLLFAVLYAKLPGNSGVIKGIVFAMIAWLTMMVVVMPMAGAGLFGLALGVMAPVMTAMLHVVFGAVLGVTFKKL